MKLNNIKEALDFEELFGPDDYVRPKAVSVSEPYRTNKTLRLYRGFFINDIEKYNNYAIMKPGEQDLIWFTHKLISHYNPIEYAKNRGDHLLIYDLECYKHEQEVKWDDGSTSTKVPREILDMSEPTQNSKYYMGYELPDGWFFTYKTEKFIGCDHPIKIKYDQIQINERF